MPLIHHSKATAAWELKAVITIKIQPDSSVPVDTQSVNSNPTNPSSIKGSDECLVKGDPTIKRG